MPSQNSRQDSGGDHSNQRAGKFRIHAFQDDHDKDCQDPDGHGPWICIRNQRKCANQNLMEPLCVCLKMDSQNILQLVDRNQDSRTRGESNNHGVRDIADNPPQDAKCHLDETRHQGQQENDFKQTDAVFVR